MVCVNGLGWVDGWPGTDVDGPSYGDVITVRWFGIDPYDGVPSLMFDEWPGGRDAYYVDTEFRPLSEADLSAELAETFLKGQPPSEQEVFNPQYA